jgi:Na+/proline symporter
MVRERSEKAFSTTDFGRKRYGRVMQVSIAAVSGFYMFIFIVAELTAISGIFAILTNNFAKKFEIGVTVSLGAITVLYTSIAGLPASIVTDRFQGILMAILVIMLLFAVTLEPENHVTRDEFALASNWTTQGLKAAVTLFIAIACAELFNQSTWQRVWAAESVPAMRKGFGLGSLLVFFLMMFFGVMGMIAYANDPESYDNGFKYPYLAFFDLLLPLKDAWHIITLILVTALAASSIDSLQNGLSCIFARDLVKIGWHPTWVARFLIVAINAPAIYMASKKFNVISLFLVADIVCATSVFPVFLGLQTKDRGILKAPTEVGAFLGCIAGLLTIIVIGIIQGSVSDAFWLRNGGICALCGTETMVSFLVVPSISFVATYLCSYIDLKIRGDRARRPIFPVPFDQDDEGKEAKDLEDCRSSEDSPTDSPTDDKAVDDSELQEVLEGVNLDDEDSVNTEKIQATHEGGGTY